MKIFSFTALVFSFSSLFAEADTNFEKNELFEKNRSIIFIHIPKTAGISTVVFSQESLKKKPVLVDKNPGGLKNHFPETAHDKTFSLLLSRYLTSSFYNFFLWSHMPYTYAAPYKDRALLFTILRDPVERQLSHRRFFKLQVNVKPEEILHAEDNILHSSSTQNMQTLYLSSLDPYDSSIDIHDHLQSAKYNLKHNIAFFGLTEYLDESLNELCKKQNLSDIKPVKKVNVTSDKPFLKEPYDYEKMKQDNWADVQLYAFAKNLFFERFPHLKD
jgi:Sulfotransferase family